MAVDFRAHPPERRRRPSTVAACGCCCCCCCLHSVAGLLAPASTSRSETWEEQRGTIVYWWCVLGVTVATFAVCLADDAEGALGLIIVAVFLPACQLGAALVAAIVGLFLWGPAASRRVGRLALRGFVGGLIGLGIMAALISTLHGDLGTGALWALGVVVVVWLSIVLRHRPRPAGS